MSEVIEKAADIFVETYTTSYGPKGARAIAMAAALAYLAANVSDEMCDAAHTSLYGKKGMRIGWRTDIRRALSAALKAGAGR